MTVKIRLARCGMRHNPEYYITIANSYCARDGKYIERIGYYNSVPDSSQKKVVMLDFSRAKYWISRGASPTGVVYGLFAKAGLVPEHPFSKGIIKD
jgi:small subunit ribosomal protein S16